MNCPYCRLGFHPQTRRTELNLRFQEFDWWIEAIICPNPECGHITLDLCKGRIGRLPNNRVTFASAESLRLLPAESSRDPVPTEVSGEDRSLAEDYTEACAVLSRSPKASAALSRRCLQHILREKAGTTKRDLFDQINEVIDSGRIPSHIAESLDAVRNIGNFAAHPMKSKATGEIVDIEPGEAEWNLDTIEALFDFYYLQPAILAKKKAALNAKLQAVGKPQIK